MKKPPRKGGFLLQGLSDLDGSDQSVDGVIDVAVGFSGSVTAEAVVALDVV